MTDFKEEILAKNPVLRAGVEAAAKIRREAEQEKLQASAFGRMEMFGRPEEDPSVILYIPMPKVIAQKFPDNEHRKGHDPHITLLYVGKIGDADASTVLQVARKVCETMAPFRMFVDVNEGLQSFGDGNDGQQALWLSCRSDPRGEVGLAHRKLRTYIEREGIECKAHSGFTPHATWRYVENGASDEDIAKYDTKMMSRFPGGGFWFDVKHIMCTMPNGTVRSVALSPIPRRSVYE